MNQYYLTVLTFLIIINKDGVYNLLAGDLEGDGDVDLIRLTSHDEKDMWLMRNDLK